MTTTISDTPETAAATASTSSRWAEGTGLLVVRAVVGAVLIGHGAQKLFGAWGGGGIDGTARMFGQAGYSPAKPIAVLGGLIEFGGGIALILGLFASAAAAAIAANMAGATAVTYDSSNGVFFNGYEYPLLLMVVAFGLALSGPGRLALDHGRIWDRPAVRHALGALAIVGALVAVTIR